MKMKDVVKALLKLNQEQQVEVLDIDGQEATAIAPGCQINIDGDGVTSTKLGISEEE
jgi:hypothetical protein